MSIRRRWVATCDDPSCSATEILEGDQEDGRYELGLQLNDDGWEAAPGKVPTFCPLHAATTDAGESP